MLLLQLFIAAEGGLFFAVVLDDDDLEILVGALAVDGLHTGAQIRGMIAAGDEDAHPAGLRDGVIRLVEARGVRDHGHCVHRHAYPFIVGIQGLDGSFQTVGLGRDIAGHAGGAGAPIIQQVRDMNDLVCLFGQAQVKVVVLAAVELRPLVAAHCRQQLCAEHAQVADIVVGAEVVQHVIRLEVVNGPMVDVALKGDLVGVDEVGPLLGDGLRHIPQRTGVQDVVVVQQGDELARGQRKALVGVARNAVVFLQFLVADTRVRSGTCLHGLTHGLILSGVHKAQLPVLIGLVLHRIQQLHQELLRRIVQRHHDADERACRLVGRLLYQQLRGGKTVGGHGFAREQLFVLPLGLRLGHHAGDAHPAQRCQKDEQREGVPQLAALAHQIPHGPGELPELGLDHAVQRFFQVLLVAAAQRKIAAQAFQLGGLLSLGALGLQHPLPQVVQRPLIIQHHFLRVLRRRAAAEQSRLLGLAARFPPKIPGKALLGQLLRTAGQHCAVCAHQQHLIALHGGQFGPLRVLRYQQRAALGLLRHPGTDLFQCLFQRTAAAQHLHPGGGQLPHDVLRQLTAALCLLSGFLFLIHSALCSYGVLSSMISHKITNIV